MFWTKKTNTRNFKTNDFIGEIPTSAGTLFVECGDNFKGSRFQTMGLLHQMNLEELVEGVNILSSKNGGFFVYGRKYIEDNRQYFEVMRTSICMIPNTTGNFLVAAI